MASEEAHYFLKMVEQNRISPGCRVEGRHGELVSNPRGNKRRVREVMTGTVVEAAGEHKWAVVFNYNGVIKNVTSKSLKVVDEDTGLPLDSSSDTVSLLFSITTKLHSNYCFKH